MAYSFCCAPLPAARDFAQPLQGAEMFRDRMAASSACLSGSLLQRILCQIFIADSIRWLSTMGVSSRWKTAADRDQTPSDACANAAAEGLGSRLFLDAQSAGAELR